MGFLSGLLGGGGSSNKSTTTTTSVDSSSKIGDIGITGKDAVALARTFAGSVERQQIVTTKVFENLTGLVAQSRGLVTPESLMIVGAIPVVGILASR